MQLSGIITLTTDFGQVDSYVGVMKGVMLGIAPQVRLIDTTHDIKPHNIQQAAYIVDTFHRYFPTGTVHMVVVDPGVGSSRQAIALQTPEGFFIAPDNGVLTYVWRDALTRWGQDACQTVALTERRFWLPQISNTFHGRDIFAPVAAHLARGVQLRELGELLPSISEAAIIQPFIGHHSELVGRIIHVDHFGNCITNIDLQTLETFGALDTLTLRVIDQRIHGLRRTYADAASGALLALIGSSSRLELAVCNGNAAQTLGVGIGDRIRVYR